MRLLLFIFSTFAVAWCSAMVTITAAVNVAPADPAHKFYTSFTQVEYNIERKIVEVSMRIFADDLESILTKRHGRSIRFGQTKDAEALAFAYLKGAFQIRNRGGAVKEIRWVGMESKVDIAWLYFEIEMPEGIDGAEVRNRVLLDFSDEQVNIIHIKRDGQKADLVFKKDDSNFKACP